RLVAPERHDDDVPPVIPGSGVARGEHAGYVVERRAALDAEPRAAVVVRRRAHERQVERGLGAQTVARAVHHRRVLDAAPLRTVDEDAVAALAAIDCHAQQAGADGVPDRDALTLRRVDDGVLDRRVRGRLHQDALAAARALDHSAPNGIAAAIHDADA